MVKIEAIIRPGRLNAVKSALSDAGFDGITVVDVHGIGNQKKYAHTNLGPKFITDVIDKTRIEVFVRDKDVDEVTTTIIEHARTGEIGDGRIFLTRVSWALRIRNGDEAETAL